MRDYSVAALAELPVPETVAGRLGLPAGALRLRRAWPRSASHLLLEYEGAGGVIAPGQWWADPAAADDALRGANPQTTALMWPAGCDGVVALQLRGADRRLPGLAPLLGRPGARLMVHQPGRRAVVRLGEGGATVFAKVVRPGRAGDVAALGAAVERLGGGAFTTPRLLTVDGPGGVVCWSALPGVALHELRGRAALEAGARRAGRALRALHAAAPPAQATPHGPDAERRTLERWAALAAAYTPGQEERLARLVADVGGALARARGPLVTIHRDFYDKQILVATDGEIGLLDFDTLACGEPALDLANALVHLELRALQGLIPHADAARAQRALMAGYDPGPTVRSRLDAYARATYLRLACVYQFRPRWSACVGALLERAEYQELHAPCSMPEDA